MNVLIVCDESQVVTAAFRALGHEAFSCDIIDCSGGHPEWHIKFDALLLINGNCSFKTCDGIEHHIDGSWDLLIAHPPCTYLSSAGNSYFNIVKYANSALLRKYNRDIALDFFIKFLNADCEKICVENPVGYVNSHYRQPDQIIHPYYFCNSVNDESYTMKRTCLWLKNLPLLIRTNDFCKPQPKYTRLSGHNVYFTESVHSQQLRSKTFPSIANAMADQWGKPYKYWSQLSLFS